MKITALSLIGVCAVLIYAQPNSDQYYSLDDLYNRATTGATGRAVEFAEPREGPDVSTGTSVNGIMERMPAVHHSAASAAEVVAGKYFWGLDDGSGWGQQVGAMEIKQPLSITPGPAHQTIPAGYYGEAGSVAGDANLTAENIKSGTTVFGVRGKSTVVETEGATAHAGDILSGRTAWVDGEEVTGEMGLVSYYLNRGYNHAQNSAWYVSSDLPVTLQEPFKYGYTFEGWYEEEGFITAVTEIPEGSTGNKSLHAKWSVNQYTVTFHAQGGSAPEPENTQVTYDQTYGTVATTARENYRFMGWFTDSTGGVHVTSESSVQIAMDLSLYAHWSREYSLTYALNNATNHGSNPALYITLETITLHDPIKNDPISADYWTFDGWYEDANFTTQITTIPAGSTGNIEVHAKWSWNGPDPLDGNGNSYTTVQIGNQVWTIENLRTTKYADGTPIPHVTDSSDWVGLSTPAYCWYNNDSLQGYGVFYNWWVVDTLNEHKIAPEGWRVPTLWDWETLAEYLGGDPVAGGKMKTTGTSNWASPNTEATNESGFSALPGGFRIHNDAIFSNVAYAGRWWSATETVSGRPHAYQVSLDYNHASLTGIHDYKNNGFSVRLVRDID
jgi:uncharacterized protein (TIGR02145 family)/uncharacterized repeat protein (TIGR02543 family)